MPLTPADNQTRSHCAFIFGCGMPKSPSGAVSRRTLLEKLARWFSMLTSQTKSYHHLPRADRTSGQSEI